MYRAAVRRLEGELQLERKQAEREQSATETRVLGQLRMKLVADRRRTLELIRMMY